jgi:hypothetical protein
MSDHDNAFGTVTEPLDIGWHDWVTANLGTDPGRAARATRAAAEAVAQGLGFNAAADAARASWDVARLAHVATVRRADPATVPGSLVAATALAVGGALASIALILWISPPTPTCTDLCPSFRFIAYLFLSGNVAVAGLHTLLFLLMWRRRSAVAWWASVTLVGGILLFDILGELTVVAVLSNPNSQPILGGIGTFPALVATAMIFVAEIIHPGGGWDGIASHWLLVHLLLVELPILTLLSTRPARRWCRVYFMGGQLESRLEATGRDDPIV